FALVGLQPGDPALDRLLGGRDPRLAKDVQHQAGRVAIAARVLSLRLTVLALPGTNRWQAPTAVLALQGQQGLEGALALGLAHQAVEGQRRPQEVSLVVEVRGRRLLYWFSENRKNAFERLATVYGVRRSLITL